MKRLLPVAALAAVFLAAPASAGEGGEGHEHPAPGTAAPNPANPGGSAAPS